MEKEKLLDFSSKKELVEVAKLDELKKVASSLVDCLISIKEKGKAGLERLKGVAKSIGQKIVDSRQVTGEDLTLTEESIDSILSHYGF